MFAHGGRSDEDGVSRRLVALREALQLEFAECDADPRVYVPHLPVGQASGLGDTRRLGGEVEGVVGEFAGGLVGSGGRDGRDGEGVLVWCVDRVFVIERMGFHDPFQIVGDVELIGEDEAQSDSEVT